MDIEKYLLDFERKLILHRYSKNSISNCISAVNSFLKIAEQRFSSPSELGENEKYVFWKIEKPVGPTLICKSTKILKSKKTASESHSKTVFLSL